MPEPLSDIEIARAARLQPIEEIGGKLDIPHDALQIYGGDKAKISARFCNKVAQRPPGKLILVTAVNPTAAGEGKTTTTVGLGDALNLIGKRAAICIREPSLGPCFGMKGGAAGGGYAQVVPMDDINLHFTGDFHAVTAAHNLLSAMIDNHIYWKNELGIDSRRIAWRRVMDINDRALREITCGLGGVANGFARATGFDITVASEVMAILCLSTGRDDLARRLGEIIIAQRRDKSVITARDLNADGAMSVLLKDAASPNLVQTLEGNPAFVHGGPFANIAHGCNSVIATRTALGLADYVVTEAGFGADLGAEKFFNIKCRHARLRPDLAVIVATVRAMKLHGGGARDRPEEANAGAVKKGVANLVRHIQNVKQFGVPVLVAINRFSGDRDDEIDIVRQASRAQGAQAIICTHWADGGAGAGALAEAVVENVAHRESQFAPLYPDSLPLFEKIETVARRIYRASEVVANSAVRARLREFEAQGFGGLPVCMAKTQYSFSSDPHRLGAPEGHVLPVREVRLAAGARFVVALAGDIMTMPGLPRAPAAERIRFDGKGDITGLF